MINWYRSWLPRHSTGEESFQLPRPYRVLKFPDGFGLDLADAFTRHLEDAADFFEGICVPVANAVAELDDLALAVGQRLEHLLDLVLEHLLGRALDRVVGLLVF